jgi:hypothetical protein
MESYVPEGILILDRRMVTPEDTCVVFHARDPLMPRGLLIGEHPVDGLKPVEKPGLSTDRTV